MKNILDYFKNNVNNFANITTSPLILGTETLAWDASIFANDGTVIGGGINFDRKKAIQIAIAETLERHYFKLLIKNNKSKNEYFLNKYPTTCGFALGFENNSTLKRAIFEAYERWAWSKWIDLNCPITQIFPNLKGIKCFFSQDFNEIIFFEKRFFNFELGKELILSISIGLTEQGAFPGSKVDYEENDGLTHALSESWRHKKHYDAIKNKTLNNLADKRLVFFGRNKDLALKQIFTTKDAKWPTPKPLMQARIALQQEDIYLYRVLYENFIGWHVGGETRFVY